MDDVTRTLNSYTRLVLWTLSIRAGAQCNAVWSYSSFFVYKCTISKTKLNFKHDGAPCAEDWDRAVSVESLACSTQWKLNLFFRSSKSMEVHQLLHCQFIFVKTCSDKEASDSFIKAHQKMTKVIYEKLFKSYQVYQAASQYECSFFNIVDLICGSICGSQENIQEIQDSPPVLHDFLLQSFANSTIALLP